MKDTKLARYGDTWKFGDYPGKQERVNDRQTCTFVICRARLGPRTHRGKERFPVMTVTCALLQIVHYRRCQFDLVFNAMCDDTCSAASFTSEGGN